MKRILATMAITLSLQAQPAATELSGRIDGVNLQFAVPGHARIMAISRNGLEMSERRDYLRTGRTITFVPAQIPAPGDVLTAQLAPRSGLAAIVSRLFVWVRGGK